MLYKWIILPHQTSIFRSLKREQYFSGALGKMNINIPTCTFIHTLKLSSKLQSIKCLLSRKTNLSARVLNCIFSRFVRNIMKNISLAQSVSTFSTGSLNSKQACYRISLLWNKLFLDPITSSLFTAKVLELSTLLSPLPYLTFSP